jgi:ABC-type branched-subunit amino acid transport system ATPase component
MHAIACFCGEAYIVAYDITICTHAQVIQLTPHYCSVDAVTGHACAVMHCAHSRTAVADTLHTHTHKHTGIGLVGEATVLYLDEPTTGLDSAAAHTVVEYITQVAQKTGVIVVMTIHQPSGQVFNMLQVLLPLS